MLTLSKEPQAIRNSLLVGLPSAELKCLRPFLHPIAMRERTVLYEQKRRIEHVHFVESGLISLRTQISGSILETAIIGSQGSIGASVALGWELSFCQAIVLVPGKAWKIHVSHLWTAMTEYPLIREHILRHSHALTIQCAQTALCGARHELEPRLAGWLCHASGILGHQTLPITHECLSMALGLRRSGVTETLNRFESQGFIQKTRGILELSNVEGLKHKACGCYGVIADAYQSAKLLCSVPDQAPQALKRSN